MFHLVFHKRCRFCRHDLRPFEKKSIVTVEDFKNTESNIKSTEARTCSVCLVKCQDNFGRIKHEETVHEGKEKQFKCDQCDSRYSNTNALNYHKESYHGLGIKFTCNLCGLKCSSDKIFLRHKESVHDEKHYECSKCGQDFNRKDNLKRHKKEKHYASKANFDFVEDLDELGVLNCDKCDQKFKRSSNLKRHYTSVHIDKDDKKNFHCDQCTKSFSRKDALSRHVGSNH